MLRSMTGFGAAHGAREGVEYRVETRSVNNRYLKTSIKLPELWSQAELEVEKLLRERVQRGTVYLTVRMRIANEQAAHRVNLPALNAYIDQLRGLEIEANPTMRIDLGGLLQLPGVCEAPDLEELCQNTRTDLMRLIAQALDELVQTRQREGQSLARELSGNCKVVLECVGAVDQAAPKVIAGYRDRLAARMQEFAAAGTAHVDAEQIAREVAIFGERCDITEEIARLRSHVEHFLAAMDAPEPAGRKLDFIAQEMLREANTIASKANDVEIAHTVVAMKTAIDRIKEQVQNAE